MPWSAISNLIGNIANIQFQDMTNKQEYQHFLENRAYNEPVNQIDRLKRAGLNPALGLGGMSQSANPSSLTAPQMDVGSLSDAIGGISSRALRKDQLNLAKQEFAIKKAVNDIKMVLLAKGIREKDLNLAIKAINLETAQQVQPFIIQNAENEAGIKENKRAMSDMDFENYPAYLQGISKNLEARTNQSNAMAQYYTGKPEREQSQIKINRANSAETARHNQAQERISENAVKMSHADRMRAINVAIKQYNLAVRKQNWDEAHYWYDLAAGVGSQISKLAGSYAGWKFGLPIDKWW